MVALVQAMLSDARSRPHTRAFAWSRRLPGQQHERLVHPRRPCAAARRVPPAAPGWRSHRAAVATGWATSLDTNLRPEAAFPGLGGLSDLTRGDVPDPLPVFAAMDWRLPETAVELTAGKPRLESADRPQRILPHSTARVLLPSVLAIVCPERLDAGPIGGSFSSESSGLGSRNRSRASPADVRPLEVIPCASAIARRATANSGRPSPINGSIWWRACSRGGVSWIGAAKRLRPHRLLDQALTAGVTGQLATVAAAGGATVSDGAEQAAERSKPLRLQSGFGTSRWPREALHWKAFTEMPSMPHASHQES